ncbi:MAG: carbohydrate-binding family 9-like protein, partial [Thermoguttaceae bacterium]
NLYLRFHVEDRYVICTHSKFQDPVCQDSCVEFFVQPRPSAGYFNFEINCGGTLHSAYIEDPRRTPDGFARFKLLSAEDGRRVLIAHSMSKLVSPEKPGPVIWQIGCKIPLAVLETYVGPLGPLPGQVWRGNFFKCADKSSHPHWASWAPIGEKLNFHQPKYFAPLRFARANEDNSHATVKGSPHEPGRPPSNPRPK